MAPVNSDIPDLAISSLELDLRSSSPTNLAAYLDSLTLAQREAITHPDPESRTVLKREIENDLSTANIPNLVARDTAAITGHPNYSGAVNPNDINMKGVQAMFAIIGVCFVLGAIWFFFWAKNGGFQWRRGDWEEYKSTVLRRRGPNGTTLSNATKSTILGGGSVVGAGYSDKDGFSDDTRTVITGTMTELSSSTAPIIKEKQSRGGQNKQKETAKEKKQREMAQAGWEGGHDDDVRAYRHEKPARVGGINRDSDALHYGTDYTDTDGSSVAYAPNTRRQQNQNRSSRNASPEKRQSRRDFSYGNDAAFSTTSASERAPSPPPARVPAHATQPTSNPRPQRYHSPSKTPQPANRQSVPGGYYTQPIDFSDVQSQNTKSYHHPIPGLSGNTGARPGGYRRDRGDGLDD